MARWKIHSRDRGYLQRVSTAVDFFQRTSSKYTKLFCALSGGKDSVAMAGVMAKAGLADKVPLMHATCAFNLPDTLDIVERVAEKLDMDLDIEAPDNLDYHVENIHRKWGGDTVMVVPRDGYTEWDLLRAVHAHKDVTDKSICNDVFCAISAGNMGVSYMYANGFDGVYLGIRADESRARAARAKFFGKDHKHIDETVSLCPLLSWSSDDVYTFIHAENLPLHPYYRAAYESSKTESDPGRIRVDLAITPDSIASRGSMATLRSVYREHFEKLAAVRPELKGYVLWHLEAVVDVLP